MTLSLTTTQLWGAAAILIAIGVFVFTLRTHRRDRRVIERERESHFSRKKERETEKAKKEWAKIKEKRLINSQIINSMPSPWKNLYFEISGKKYRIAQVTIEALIRKLKDRAYYNPVKYSFPKLSVRQFELFLNQCPPGSCTNSEWERWITQKLSPCIEIDAKIAKLLE